MIIDLRFKNWMSFRNETHVSFVALGEKRLLARVPNVRKTPVLNISPASVLYGGNASGKTNFFTLFAFLRRFVLSPTNDENKEIPIRQFALHSAGKSNLTEIDLTFLAGSNDIFSLHIVLSKQAVIEESLSVIKASKPKLLYSRHGEKIEIHSAQLKRNSKVVAFSKITKKNQLFFAIAASASKPLTDARSWFSSQLNLIGTNSSFGAFGKFLEDKKRLDYFGKLLSKFDTGICKLTIEESAESALPPAILEDIKDDLADSTVANLNISGSRFVVKKNNEKLIIKKIVSFHKNENGDCVKFDLRQESEGTLRLIDILPAFIKLEEKNSNQVYIIDELDRSWHYFLSRQLLGTFLGTCSEDSRSQLIFSTHDLLLMDQDIFRKGEMFVVERNEHGISSIYSLNHPDIRYDKDIRKMYIQGKLGGIPQLLHFGPLTDWED